MLLTGRIGRRISHQDGGILPVLFGSLLLTGLTVIPVAGFPVAGVLYLLAMGLGSTRLASAAILAWCD